MSKPLCLRFGCKRESGYVHYFARPVELDTTKHDDTPYGNVCYLESWGERSPLRDFYVWSQGKDDDEPRRLYGIECQFRDLYSLDAREIGEMHKAIKAVEASLRKQEADDGYADSLGRFIGRVAKALKCKYVLVEYGHNSNSGYKYRALEIGEAINVINYQVQQWVSDGAGVCV